MSSRAAREGRSVGPYRDPRDALIARRRALESDLRVAAGVADRAERVRKYLPVLDAELREATAPFVDAIGEETRCRERWDEMEGSDATRRCARCDRHVYDLSTMTRDEIATLFARAGALRRRGDGRVVVGDCVVRTLTASRGTRVLSVAALAALVGGGFYVAGALTRAPSVGKRVEAVEVAVKEIEIEDGPALVPAPAASPAPAAHSEESQDYIRSTGPNTWEVDESLIRRALNHPEHPISVRIVPHAEDGRTVGVKLYGIRRSSMLHALGIRSGDLLLSVNGFPLSSPDAAIEIYRRLRAPEAVFLELRRGDEERVHAYRVVRDAVENEGEH